MTALLRRRRPFLRVRALIAVGLVSLAAGTLGLWKEFGFLTRIEQVEAEVVSVETLGASETFAIYRPTMRYSPTPGETIERAAAETYRPTRIGETLTVGFDPMNIDDVRLLDIRDRWLSPLWILLLAVVTLGVAYHRWRNPPEAPTEE